MDISTDDRDNRPRVNSTDGDNSQAALVVSVKIAAVLFAVLILSLGIVGCSIFFIWMCFLHPDAAQTLLPLIIPAAVTALTVHFGKKAQQMIAGKDDKTSIETSNK